MSLFLISLAEVWSKKNKLLLIYYLFISGLVVQIYQIYWRSKKSNSTKKKKKKEEEINFIRVEPLLLLLDLQAVLSFKVKRMATLPIGL